MWSLEVSVIIPGDYDGGGVVGVLLFEPLLEGV
jgi:hypothetical protein